MNRILFESGEIVGDKVTFADARAEHVLNVLHSQVGDTLKTGEIDGLVGTSRIERIDRGEITVAVDHRDRAPASWCDLILAPPRPRVMKRLLPQLATMGVGRIVLVGAEKVEKDFWGATLLKPGNYRPLLIEGLMQGGVSELPRLECWKSFKRFMREGLSAFGSSSRIVAHPYAVGQSVPAAIAPGRPLLAVGPEGGWTDDEVGLLEANGFVRRSLGPRILKTETAVTALLALTGLTADSFRIDR